MSEKLCNFAAVKEIVLDGILPRVFLEREDLGGDIWRQRVVLERGGVYLVEAASGTGKSSLCGFLAGYRRDYEGRLLMDGREARSLRTEEWVEIRRRHVSLLFQELRLFPELTALENVEIKNQLTRHKTQREILDWFEALGLSDKVNARVGQMSFGQQQRVAMIRALCQPFDFLLADEPVSHLDDQNARVMSQVMTEEAGRQGAAVLVTSIGKRMELSYDKTFSL